MIPDSLHETVKWVSYKNPVVTNTVQGFNSAVKNTMFYNNLKYSLYKYFIH